MTSTAGTTSAALAPTHAVTGRAAADGWPEADDQCSSDGVPHGSDDRLFTEQFGVLAGPCGTDTDAGGTDAAAVLWARFLKFDAADPCWPDRDRFVRSPGHGAGLHRALLRLTGASDLAEPQGHDASHGGEGFAAAVGMALAERFLAARFGRTLVDHRTWVLASDADLMQGVSHEAASLAGQLRLERLAVLWDADTEPGAGRPDCRDALRRFAAYGWTTRSVARHDHAALAAALAAAQRSRRPTLIACRPAAAPPSLRRLPPAMEAAALARWLAVGRRGATLRRGWLKRLAHHPRRGEFERAAAGALPQTLDAALQAVKAALAGASGMATREASERVLAAVKSALPDLVGGAADPTGAGAAGGWRQAGSFASRFLNFGSREHGMAAAMNGMAAHGGVLPYGSTACALSESVRPALRLAALMKQRVVHVLTHDTRAPAAGGPAHGGVEHLASLRAVPNLHVLRPADAVETAECWELALRRDDGPSLLVLGRETVPRLRGDSGTNRCAEGGYVLAEADGARRATLIATGSEVALALAARGKLAAERIAVAVVSLPCWDLFARAGAAHHAQVLGGAMRFGIEAGSGFGWERWLGADGVFIGCEDFSAAADLTPEAIAVTVRRCLAA